MMVLSGLSETEEAEWFGWDGAYMEAPRYVMSVQVVVVVSTIKLLP